jgi:hypothetical protein
MRSIPGAVLILSATALAAWAGSQSLYLPATGPVAVRFRAEPDPAAARAVLGPLPSEPSLPEPEPASANANAPVPAANEPPPAAPAPAPVLLPSASTATPDAPSVVAPKNPPPAAPAPGQGFVLPAEPNSPAALTPQMLMQFFKDKGGRRDDSGVLVPLTLPPPPVARPSSTATFNSP